MQRDRGCVRWATASDLFVFGLLSQPRAEDTTECSPVFWTAVKEAEAGEGCRRVSGFGTEESETTTVASGATPAQTGVGSLGDRLTRQMGNWLSEASVAGWLAGGRTLPGNDENDKGVRRELRGSSSSLKVWLCCILSNAGVDGHVAQGVGRTDWLDVLALFLHQWLFCAID